jgi:hypothetical protein
MTANFAAPSPTLRLCKLSPALEHSVMSPASQSKEHPNSSLSLKTSLNAANMDAILLQPHHTINLVPFGNQTFRSCQDHLNNKEHLVSNILVELWHDTVANKVER